jgi:hypothetical protein
MLTIALVLSAAAFAAEPDEASVYTQAVRPVFEQYCFDCHGERMKGDVDLRPYTDLPSLEADRDTFERVLAVMQSGEMPPSNKPQPAPEEKVQVVEWLQANLFPLDCTNPDPGRVTVRRLNRAEYNNTIRDLIGIDFRPADDFPEDDAGYGFDNIGDVLSLPPVLLEKYLAAAEEILDEALDEREERGGTPDVQPLSDSHRRILGDAPPTDPSARDVRRLLRRFAMRAYRRPVSRAEVDRLVQLYGLARDEGDRFAQAVKLPLLAVLVSPHFLFRGEVQTEPDNPAAVHPIDEYALASRLSYFLWSSMPDRQLFNLARNGKLRANLEAQVERMLRDPRSGALVENFAGQWLQLRNLEIVKPDSERFPNFDDALRRAMRQETEMFFEQLLRENGRITDFLEAPYTFVNDRLARHYGIPDINGGEFRRVSLTGTHRGGVLTHASILTLTSNPTRTSPVKRGKWVLDNLLGSPPPPPPPEVPELESQAELTGTLRERMEQHRENPNCISCHERMDPIGFGLEHFDGIGAWREFDGESAIDASGRLVTGESFEGIDELRAILAERRRDNFVRCLSEKMLIYALGRGLEFYDACAVERIVEQLELDDYRFSSLVHAITQSVPFQLRRGDGER